MAIVTELRSTKVKIAIIAALTGISFVFFSPVLNLITALICIPYLLYLLSVLMPGYLKRKCPQCGTIMSSEYDVIFDGAESSNKGGSYPPVALQSDSCLKCGALHLRLFNPPGVLSDNVGGFNALHHLADEDFINIHSEAIKQGGRLPRVHYITPEAHNLLIKKFVERARRVNTNSGFKYSPKDVKDFIKYMM